MLKKKSARVRNSSYDESLEEEHVSKNINNHRTLDFLECERELYFRSLKQVAHSNRPKEQDEIYNLESWHRRYIKLKNKLNPIASQKVFFKGRMSLI
jgi:hypothetical protein